MDEHVLERRRQLAPGQARPVAPRGDRLAEGPGTVELGIVTGIFDEGRATLFFRGLGYRSRGMGAPTLGRRLFIGPFTSQGALEQALEVARQAGFIAPHVAERVRF